MKRPMTKEEKQSMADRTRLIDALKAVRAAELAPSPGAAARMDARIAELERRNADPKGSLGIGARLWSNWHYGETACGF